MRTVLDVLVARAARLEQAYGHPSRGGAARASRASSPRYPRTRLLGHERCGPRDPILFDVRDGLAHVTLNRPARLNAVDPDAIARWKAIALEIAERDDIGAVLFDAVGRAFCAGGDVRAMAELAGDGCPGAHDHRTRRPDPRRAPRPAREHQADRRRRAGARGRWRTRLHARGRPRRGIRPRDLREPVLGRRPHARLRREHAPARGGRHAARARAHAHLAHADRRRSARLGTRRRGRGARGARRPRARDRGRVAGRCDRGLRAGQAPRALGARPASFQDALDDEARTIGAAFETPYAQAAVARFASGSGRRPADA